MYCSNCGAGNQNGARFCEMCGMPLADASGTGVRGGGRRGGSVLTSLRERLVPALRKILRPATAVIAAVVVLSVIAAVFAVRLLSRSEYSLREDTLVMGYDGDLDAELFAFASNGTVMHVKETPVYAAPSLDGMRYAVLTSDSSLYFFSADEDAPRKIAMNAAWCRIAPDGGSVIYYDELTETLCLYTTADGRRTVLSEDVRNPRYATVAAGGAVAYYEQKDDKTYLNDGGDITYIGKGLIPLAVSDNGKYVYLVGEDNGNVYTYSAKNGITKLSSDCSGTFLFNSDATEMLFVNGRNRAVLVTGGAKQTELMSTGYGLYCLQPDGAASMYDDAGSIRYDIDGFVGQFVVESDSGGSVVYRIKRSGECERLADNVDSAMVGAEGDDLFYTSGGDLYAASPDGDASEFLLADVISAVPVGSGGCVYAINEDHELWELTASGRKERIADDVYSVAVSGRKVVYYLAEDYRSSDMSLYAYRRGKSEFLAEDAVTLTDTGGYIIARTDYRDGLCTVCACVGNGRLSPLMEDVAW